MGLRVILSGIISPHWSPAICSTTLCSVSLDAMNSSLIVMAMSPLIRLRPSTASPLVRGALPVGSGAGAGADVPGYGDAGREGRVGYRLLPGGGQWQFTCP